MVVLRFLIYDKYFNISAELVKYNIKLFELLGLLVTEYKRFKYQKIFKIQLSCLLSSLKYSILVEDEAFIITIHYIFKKSEFVNPTYID